MKYKKHKRTRKMNNRIRKTRKYCGGLKEYTDSGVSDTTKLLDHYLVKRIVDNKKYDNILVKSDYNDLTIGPNDLLIVIDMQNDFVDRPMEGLTGPEIEGGNLGSFCVNNGKSIIEPIIELVKKFKTNNGNVLFTRDVHPCEHCSFHASCEGNPQSGPFPPHCVNKTRGSGFVEEIKDYLDRQTISNSIVQNGRGQISVVFKGCDINTDSFGAFKYQDNDYGKARQIACKPENLSKTGSFYSIKPSDYNKKKVIEYNFDAIDAIGNFSNRFRIPKSIKNVYVVGLAGDFCVCDTALNVKKSYPEKNVSVIYELTRNAFIPFINPNDSILKDIQKNEVSKPLENYAFVYEGSNVRSLKNDELIKLTLEDLKNKFHFLTDINVLFDRYQDKEVHVILNNDTIDAARNSMKLLNNITHSNL
jgi:nicotinamidase-related amidase